MKNLLFHSLILMSLFLQSCNNASSEEPATVDKEDSINCELRTKYAISDSIPLRLHFSIEFESLLHKPLIIDDYVDIIDIYKDQSQGFVKIRTGFSPVLLCILSLSMEQINRLTKGMDKVYRYHYDGAIVIKLDSVSKLDFRGFISHIDEYSVSIEFEHSETFIAHGELLEAKSYK